MAESWADIVKQVFSICGFWVSQAFFDVTPWCSWLSANEITNAILISAPHLVTLIRQPQKCHQSDLRLRKLVPILPLLYNFRGTPISYRLECVFLSMEQSYWGSGTSTLSFISHRYSFMLFSPEAQTFSAFSLISQWFLLQCLCSFSSFCLASPDPSVVKNHTHLPPGILP